jgi:hypothetical protein
LVGSRILGGDGIGYNGKALDAGKDLSIREGEVDSNVWTMTEGKWICVVGNIGCRKEQQPNQGETISRQLKSNEQASEESGKRKKVLLELTNYMYQARKERVAHDDVGATKQIVEARWRWDVIQTTEQRCPANT